MAARAGRRADAEDGRKRDVVGWWEQPLDQARELGEPTLQRADRRGKEVKVHGPPDRLAYAFDPREVLRCAASVVRGRGYVRADGAIASAAGGGKANDDRGAGGNEELAHTDLEEGAAAKDKNLAKPGDAGGRQAQTVEAHSSAARRFWGPAWRQAGIP
jgi:hypothetical protein